ncbi:PAR10 polymerase, partial [Polyodon spathula]|nr:PAR10 polymerase [Polyodon spathula]
MSENSSEGRTVEVSGIPNEVEDEFLGLFFENKRRSGGGALASLCRQGSHAILIFEDAEVAKRVLSKGTHVLNNAKLTVRKPTPKDPGKVLLRGMNASTAKEIVELFVENVTKLDSTGYLMYPSPRGDTVLVQFHKPLSEQEFRRLADKVRGRLLDGARIEAEQIERTDSVIVEGLRSTTTEDMLALYFENKRGGGEEVGDVTVLADGMARVTFEDWEAVDRILQRSHKLDGRDLSLRPYFDFLLPGQSPLSPSILNGTEEVHADSAGHTDSTGDLYTDTLGCDTTREDLTDSTREMYPDSPKVYFSNILLHDPVKLNLLQCSHFLQELQQGHQDFGIQIVGNGVTISGPNQLTSEQLKQRILE